MSAVRIPIETLIDDPAQTIERLPSGVALHFSDLEDVERAWAGAVQVTTPARTVIDCATADVSPGVVKTAIDEGTHRGLFTAAMVEPASEYLRSFEAGDS